MPWIKPTREGVLLTIHLTPRAKHDTIKGLYGEALKVRIKAPPVDGKANAYLVAYLAERLGIPRARVSLTKGASSRTKQVFITGCGEKQVRKSLLEELLLD